MKKIYIIRKFVVADSIEDALKKEKKIQPADCWLDEHSAKEMKEEIITKQNKI